MFDNVGAIDAEQEAALAEATGAARVHVRVQGIVLDMWQGLDQSIHMGQRGRAGVGTCVSTAAPNTRAVPSATRAVRSPRNVRGPANRTTLFHHNRCC